MVGSRGDAEQGKGRPAAGAFPRAAGFLSPSLAFLLYTLLALITTHPLWLHLADSVPGDIGDPLLNTWIVAWDAYAALVKPLGLFNANIFYPLPNTLAYSEHLFSTAALALPLGLASNQPLVAYNLSLLFSFPLAGLGMYLLLLGWTHRRGAAFLAGLAYAFAPYRLTAIAHLQLVTVQWLPFSLLALDRLLDRVPPGEGYGVRRRRSSSVYAAQFVIFTTLQALASWYLAVFTALVLGLYTLGWCIMRLRRGDGERVLAALGRVAFAALCVVVLALPFALPYLDVLPQLQAARPAWLAASFGARPTDFLTAPPYLRVAGPLSRTLAERPGFTEENALFLGVVAPLLALAGLVVGRPRWRTVTLVAILIISLVLTFAGPYWALTRLLPALTVVRVPPRWIIPAKFAIAALAGLGVAELGNRKKASPGSQYPVFQPWWLALLLVAGVLLFIESYAAPIPLARVGGRGDLPPVYHALREKALREPAGWAVVEIPMHAAPAPEFPETKRMYASSLGWWGLVNGYSGFTPARQTALGQVLAGFPDETSQRALRRLGADGVRYLVVHADEAPLDRADWETTERWEVERGTSLVPVGGFGPDDLYLINPYGDELIINPAAVTDPYWSAHAPRPVNARFQVPDSGAEVGLLAYFYQAEDWGAGKAEPRLTLYWQTTAPLDTEYTVFVHSLNAKGELVGQADGPPVANHYATTAWGPGEIVQDSRPLPPGDRYLVGLYNAASGERLPAFAPDGTRLADDAVPLLVTGER